MNTLDRKVDPDRKLLNAARALSIDRVTAEVVAAMDEAGIPTIVLKGPSIARWLYPNGGRTYGDTDLLVPARQFAPAEGVLRSLGFTEALEGFHPSERTPDSVETAFVRRVSTGARRGGTVDLHRNLPGLATPDDLLWDTFSAGCETMLIGGVDVRVLNRTGVALHVVVHAVQHACEFHTDEDLRRAIDALSVEEWREVAALAQRLGIDDVVGFGLRRHPKGAEVAEHLGLPQLALAGSAYFWKNSHAPRGAQSLSLACSAPTVRDRARIVRRAVVPSPAKVRYVPGRAGRGGGRSLAVAYVRYWRRLATSLPPAVRFVMHHRQGPQSEGDRS